jgi:hypothetical protein
MYKIKKKKYYQVDSNLIIGSLRYGLFEYKLKAYRLISMACSM